MKKNWIHDPATMIPLRHALSAAIRARQLLVDVRRRKPENQWYCDGDLAHFILLLEELLEGDGDTGFRQLVEILQVEAKAIDEVSA